MRARFHIVQTPPRRIHDPDQWFWYGANPADAPPPQVLNAEIVRRLGLLNAAVRRIRALGLRVLEQSISGTWPSQGEPTVLIERRRDQPIAPLLDAVTVRRWIPPADDPDALIGYATLDGVGVIWVERDRAPRPITTPEKRRCDACGHVGIDGGSTTESYCGRCDETVPYPTDDLCPICGATNCMLIACPKCGGRYSEAEENGDDTTSTGEPQ
jgi:hypothetical protein